MVTETLCKSDKVIGIYMLPKISIRSLEKVALSKALAGGGVDDNIGVVAVWMVELTRNEVGSCS